jgi:hypothetical protein
MACPLCVFGRLVACADSAEGQRGWRPRTVQCTAWVKHLLRPNTVWRACHMLYHMCEQYASWTLLQPDSMHCTSAMMAQHWHTHWCRCRCRSWRTWCCSTQCIASPLAPHSTEHNTSRAMHLAKLSGRPSRQSARHPPTRGRFSPRNRRSRPKRPSGAAVGGLMTSLRGAFWTCHPTQRQRAGGCHGGGPQLCWAHRHGRYPLC